MPEIIREDDTSPIFAKVSVTGGDPSDDNDLARKKYVDDNSGGAPLGFTPEDVANKDTDGTLSANSDTKYPSQKAVKTYVDDNSGGGAAQSPLNGNHRKTGIANNADTNIASFPLADGEGIGFTILLSATAIKDNDNEDVAGGPISYGLFNKAGSLVVSSGAFKYANSGQGTITLGNININFSISMGIVTVAFNPGDVGDAAAVIDLDYALIIPNAKVITFL